MQFELPDRGELLAQVLELTDDNYFTDVGQCLSHRLGQRPLWNYFVQPAVWDKEEKEYCVNWGAVRMSPNFADPRFHHFLEHMLQSGCLGRYEDDILMGLTAEEAVDHILLVLSAYKSFIERPMSRL
jgi:hypothetical protein